MPLNPSGHTPTSSPPRSIRSASSLQASVAPLRRAMVLTNGSRNTRSAPSGRRNRPVASWIETIVISPSTGIVPEWLETTSAPPSVGMFSTPRTSTRNHFSAIGRSVAIRKRSVTSGSKPYSSTSKAPVRRRRRNARNRASCGSHWSPNTSVAAPRRAACQSETGMPPAGTRSTAVTGARSATGSGWAAVLLGGGAFFAGAFFTAAFFTAAFFAGALVAGGLADRPRAAEDGCVLPVPRPGRPRVPIGMISASPMDDSSVGLGQAGGDPGEHPLGPAAGGREGLGEVGDGGRGGERRLEAELAPHPGRVDAAAVGDQREQLRREVGDPGGAERGADPADGERRQRDRGPPQTAQDLREREDTVTRDVEGAGGLRGRRVPQHVDEVLLVQQLEAGVEAEHGRDDRQAEVRRQRADDVGSDDVGGADRRHADVRA